MTLAPRILVNLLAGYRVNRLRKRLKAEGNGVASQRATFAKLITQIARTEFGRANQVGAGMAYEEFQRTVAPRQHDDFLPYIDRMALGEKDVLWPGYCQFFAATAGTSTGTPRRLPVTAELLNHYRSSLRDTVLSYSGRVKHPGVFRGRHLHLGGSTQMRAVGSGYEGNLDALGALCLSRWTEANLYAPPAPVARLPDGPEKRTAIATAMVGRDVTLLAGAPPSIRAFADAVLAHASTGKIRMTNLRAVWPNLECFLHTGAPLGLFAEELRSVLGDAVNFHELYAAAEGCFATQDGDPAGGLRLLTNAGIFYEFIPVADFSDSVLPQLGAKCVPLEKVRAGVDYVLVVTTPAGLCRYVVGDIVRFVTTEPPRIQCRGRLQLRLASFGENISERELTDTLLDVCAA
ncbi:MAG TPA: GH3 auxin-responsive promoter family protein, partial [Candidatus Didemnitutus sp.]|nr:GH3 auxin-responsive promoter family protein [Candidatus Didemnitutus sp.]